MFCGRTAYNYQEMRGVDFTTALLQPSEIRFFSYAMFGAEAETGTLNGHTL